MRKLYTFFALAVLRAAALAVTPEAVVTRGQDESAAGKQAAKGKLRGGLRELALGAGRPLVETTM